MNEELTRKERRQREREKIRSLGFRAGLEYLWDYYKWRFIILAVVVLLIIFELIPWIRRMQQTTQIYVAMVNQPQTDSAQMDRLQAEFEQLEGFDRDWRQTTEFDSAMNLDPQGEDLMTKYYGNASVIRFQSLLHTKTLNVVVADRAFVEEQAAQDSFLDLTDVLPEDLVSRLSADGRVEPLTDSTGNKFSGGILLASGYLTTVSELETDSLLCVAADTPDPAVLADFIRYAVYGPDAVHPETETAETGSTA